jgi:hypothetical protein
MIRLVNHDCRRQACAAKRLMSHFAAHDKKGSTNAEEKNGSKIFFPFETLPIIGGFDIV